MKKSNIIFLSVLMALTGCSFLDKEPDLRTSIESLDQVKKLLVTAYSTADFAMVGEYSADNIVDNNSEDGTWTRYNLPLSDGEVQNELFAWAPANSASSSDGDSPVSIWSKAYMAIATVNHAFAAIEEMKKQGSKEDFAGAMAEGYLCRAYHHFVLANIFCMPYRNAELSKADLGVPYMTEPETKVHSNADRGTLTELYDNIEKDLIAGLKDIDKATFDQPKYHFNTQAAYAFAARFYLYKREYDKVIQYASLALGNNPMAMMRTEFWSKSYSTTESLLNAYSSSTSPSNFLLMTTYSTFYRSLSGRYACNRQASKATIYGSGPTWQTYTSHPCYMKVNGLYLYGNQDYGLFFMHTGEYFEYTDKIAGIGYVHNVNPVFTAEETLLCRAEAYIMQNRFDDALADLKVWDDSRKVGTTEKLDVLTEKLIESFYDHDILINGTAIGRVSALHCSDIDPEWVLSTKQTLWINCVLHLRRLETIHEGLRWFDVKRYGIEIRHKQGFNELKLPWDDPRRAIQIPQTVIEAGMQPNPIAKTTNTANPILFKGE